MNFGEALKGLESAAPVTDLLETPVATPAVEVPTETPAAAPPVEVPVQQTQNTIPPAESQTTPPAAPAIDYNAILDEMSGGTIKDKDAFTAALGQLKEFGTLKETNDKLSAEMAKAPVFVDDEVRILNELKASGASKEQIRSFQKINEYGNLSEMSDKDAIIAAMVMGGTKPSTAELKVDRDFKIGNEDLDPAEREIMDEDLRVAALNAREALNKFKADVSKINSTPLEEAQLQQQAQLIQHQATLKPYVKEVVGSIPNMGSFTLTGKLPGEELPVELKLSDDFKPKMEQYLENYFMDGMTKVTPENTREALNYARAEYIRENLPAILQQVKDETESKVTERLVAKYENRSGLKPNEENPITSEGSPNETALYMQNKVNRVGV